MNKSVRASMRVVDGEPSKRSIMLWINPSEFTVRKSATWIRVPARGAASAGRPQFVGADPETLEIPVELYGGYMPSGNVADVVETLIEWTKPTRTSLSKNQPEPPILSLEWGTSTALASFKGFLKSVTARYAFFDADGVPTRATATLVIEEVPQEVKGQNPTSGSIRARRSYVLRAGDSLQSVAYTEYGDPTLWRGLAAFNDIDDPLRVRPGQTLMIPTAPEAAQLS